jgi:hypothetical protein
MPRGKIGMKQVPIPDNLGVPISTESTTLIGKCNMKTGSDLYMKCFTIS